MKRPIGLKSKFVNVLESVSGTSDRGCITAANFVHCQTDYLQFELVYLPSVKVYTWKTVLMTVYTFLTLQSSNLC